MSGWSGEGVQGKTSDAQQARVPTIRARLGLAPAAASSNSTSSQDSDKYETTGVYHDCLISCHPQCLTHTTATLLCSCPDLSDLSLGLSRFSLPHTTACSHRRPKRCSWSASPFVGPLVAPLVFEAARYLCLWSPRPSQGVDASQVPLGPYRTLPRLVYSCSPSYRLRVASMAGWVARCPCVARLSPFSHGMAWGCGHCF